MAPTPARSPAPQPEKAFVNGRIRVAGALDHSPADWLVTRGAVIADVGRGSLPAFAGRVIDLRGGTLGPAFADAHVHLAWLATALLGPDLSACDSVADVLDAVVAWRKPGRGARRDWVVGTGFDESAWRDKRLPTRAELDRIHDDRPILLQRVCGHIGVANTAALAFATAGPHTDRDTGRLAEDDLYVLNDQVRPSADEFAAVLPDVVALLHRHGITTVHDVSSPEMVIALSRHPALRLRTTCSIPARYLEGGAVDRATGAGSPAAFFAANGLADLQLGTADTHFQVLGLKVFVDGSLGARTACLRAPYTDAPTTRGSALYDATTLSSLLETAHTAGLQLMVHAIGDSALDQALAALEPFACDGNALRHRIEHVEVAPPDVVERFARSGLWACLQPNFAARWSQPGGMNEQRLGQRLRHCNPYRTLHEAGIPIAFGSDCMPLGPLYGLHGAVAHPLESERLPAATAWHLYSHAGRAISHAETVAAGPQGQHDTTGRGDDGRSSAQEARMAIGTSADFVVFDDDPLTCLDWRRLRVIATIQRGDVVWSEQPQ